MKLAIVGPYPPEVGGTSAFLNRLVDEFGDSFNCKIFNTQKASGSRTLSDRLSRLLFFLGLSKDLAKSGIDIVHCHSTNAANLLGISIVLLVSRILGKPIVLTLHGGDVLIKLDNPLFRNCAKLVLKLPHVITVVSPQLADGIEELGIKRVLFIPNSLSYVKFESLKLTPLPETVLEFLSKHQPLVVSVGAMERVHGIDLFVKAINLIKTDYPSLGAVIIAFKSVDQGYKEEITKLIEDLHLQDNILLPNSFNNIHLLMSEADAVIRPSLTDGDSISVREAVSLGIPTIASDVGYRPEGVILFSRGDHVDLAKKLRAVLIENKNRHDSACHQNLDSKNTINKYLQAYQTAIDLTLKSHSDNYQ